MPSWTPALAIGGANTGIAYASPPTGSYSRIGNSIFFNAHIALSSMGCLAGPVTVTGPPVPALAPAAANVPIYGGIKFPSPYGYAGAMVEDDRLCLYCSPLEEPMPLIRLDGSMLTNSTELYISGFYQAAPVILPMPGVPPVGQPQSGRIEPADMGQRQQAPVERRARRAPTFCEAEPHPAASQNVGEPPSTGIFPSPSEHVAPGPGSLGSSLETKCPPAPAPYLMPYLIPPAPPAPLARAPAKTVAAPPGRGDNVGYDSDGEWQYA